MRKFVPYLFCGLAAVSFSVFAQTSASGDSQSGRSVDTMGARPDSSKAQGTVPQAGGATVTPATGAASVGSGSVQSNNEGRSVDTGGASPDSSKAQGTAPVTSPAAGTTSRHDGASDRHARDGAAAGSSRDEEARRKTREGVTSGIGGGTTTTGSGATTTTPGSTGGPSSGSK